MNENEFHDSDALRDEGRIELNDTLKFYLKVLALAYCLELAGGFLHNSVLDGGGIAVVMLGTLITAYNVYIDDKNGQI